MTCAEMAEIAQSWRDLKALLERERWPSLTDEDRQHNREICDHWIAVYEQLIAEEEC